MVRVPTNLPPPFHRADAEPVELGVQSSQATKRAVAMPVRAASASTLVVGQPLVTVATVRSPSPPVYVASNGMLPGSCASLPLASVTPPRSRTPSRTPPPRSPSPGSTSLPRALSSSLQSSWTASLRSPSPGQRASVSGHQLLGRGLVGQSHLHSSRSPIAVRVPDGQTVGVTPRSGSRSSTPRGRSAVSPTGILLRRPPPTLQSPVPPQQNGATVLVPGLPLGPVTVPLVQEFASPRRANSGCSSRTPSGTPTPSATPGVPSLALAKAARAALTPPHEQHLSPRGLVAVSPQSGSEQQSLSPRTNLLWVSPSASTRILPQLQGDARAPFARPHSAVQGSSSSHRGVSPHRSVSPPLQHMRLAGIARHCTNQSPESCSPRGSTCPSSSSPRPSASLLGPAPLPSYQPVAQRPLMSVNMPSSGAAATGDETSSGLPGFAFARTAKSGGSTSSSATQSPPLNDQACASVFAEVNAAYPMAMLINQIIDELLTLPLPPPLSGLNWTSAATKSRLSALLERASAGHAGCGEWCTKVEERALIDSLENEISWMAFERAVRRACHECSVKEILTTKFLLAVRRFLQACSGKTGAPNPRLEELEKAVSELQRNRYRPASSSESSPPRKRSDVTSSSLAQLKAAIESLPTWERKQLYSKPKQIELDAMLPQSQSEFDALQRLREPSGQSNFGSIQRLQAPQGQTEFGAIQRLQAPQRETEFDAIQRMQRPQGQSQLDAMEHLQPPQSIPGSENIRSGSDTLLSSQARHWCGTDPSTSRADSLSASVLSCQSLGKLARGQNNTDSTRSLASTCRQFHERLRTPSPQGSRTSSRCGSRADLAAFSPISIPISSAREGLIPAGTAAAVEPLLVTSPSQQTIVGSDVEVGMEATNSRLINAEAVHFPFDPFAAVQLPPEVAPLPGATGPPRGMAMQGNGGQEEQKDKEALVASILEKHVTSQSLEGSDRGDLQQWLQSALHQHGTPETQWPQQELSSRLPVLQQWLQSALPQQGQPERPLDDSRGSTRSHDELEVNAWLKDSCAALQDQRNVVSEQADLQQQAKQEQEVLKDELLLEHTTFRNQSEAQLSATAVESVEAPEEATHRSHEVELAGQQEFLHPREEELVLQPLQLQKSSRSQVIDDFAKEVQQLNSASSGRQESPTSFSWKFGKGTSGAIASSSVSDLAEWQHGLRGGPSRPDRSGTPRQAGTKGLNASTGSNRHRTANAKAHGSPSHTSGHMATTQGSLARTALGSQGAGRTTPAARSHSTRRSLGKQSASARRVPVSMGTNGFATENGEG